MTRRRYVQDAATGELIEVGDDYAPPPRSVTDAALWNDRVHQDANDPRFHSRTTHREFMKRSGLTTADDFTNTWKGDAKRRESFLQGNDPSRRADVARALHEINSQKRK